MTTLQAMRLPRASRRPSATSIAIVGALHIVIIYGLYVGLIHQWNPPPKPMCLCMSPTTQSNPSPQLPVPVTDVKLVRTRPTDPVPPTIYTEPEQTSGELTSNPGTQSGPAAPVLVGARGILSTHTIPNYPPVAIRLNETGNVLLRLSIDERGVVTAASVVRSSGYDTLDSAAVAWVVAHWRYEPATRDGKPFATTSDALVTFRLTSG